MNKSTIMMLLVIGLVALINVSATFVLPEVHHHEDLDAQIEEHDKQHGENRCLLLSAYLTWLGLQQLQATTPTTTATTTTTPTTTTTVAAG